MKAICDIDKNASNTMAMRFICLYFWGCYLQKQLQFVEILTKKALRSKLVRRTDRSHRRSITTEQGTYTIIERKENQDPRLVRL